MVDVVYQTRKGRCRKVAGNKRNRATREKGGIWQVARKKGEDLAVVQR